MELSSVSKPARSCGIVQLEEMVFHRKGKGSPVFITVLAGSPNGSTKRYSPAGRRMIASLCIIVAVLALVAVFGFFSYLEHKESSYQCQTTSKVEKSRTGDDKQLYSNC